MPELLDIVRMVVHYGLHFVFPGFLAWMLFRKHWKTAWWIMIATMAVDLDHLLADPIFVPDRCSIGFHPLHSYYAIAVYVLLLLVPNKYVKMIAVGLLLHMATDFQDCFWV